jgi:hypothetical protein
MTSTKSARVIRAADAEQAISALRTQRNQQEALITAYFQAVRAAEGAQAKIEKVRAAGAEAIAKAKAAAEAKVLQAQQDAGPVAAAVHTALVAVADVIGEAPTAELLGVSPRQIRSARRSPTTRQSDDNQAAVATPSTTLYIRSPRRPIGSPMARLQR